MFSVYAELLLLHKKEERLANLLSGASYRVRRMDDPVLEMPQQQWTELFRPEIIIVLQELKTEQTIEALDELIQLTPPGLFEMMRIKGLGGKKLAVLWQTAGIDTIEQLLQAAKRGELKKIRGFGAKTEENIIANIENYFGHKDRFHYGFVAHTANSLVQGLQKLLKTEWISLCGEIRRQYLTVAAIEVLAADVAGKMNLPLLRKYLVIESTDKQQTRAHTLDEIPVIIYHVTKAKFYYELFNKTGNEAHINTVLKKIKKKEAWSSEEAIYKEAGLPYIVPEMREDVAEWSFKHSINDLITDEDIKGVVHNHTTWSDGVDSLAEFAAACKKKKYEYVVISDHSKNAHYAGGLKEEKLFRQIEEIDKLNKKLAPFKIFKSIECDILVSGELDYTPEVLDQLDMVIVSVHQLLKMDEEKATRRLLKAIENPYTTILGHMTGRQLLIRPGYPVNFKKIIDACAANNVVIEINANPYRLDMDWSHLPYALEKGVMISINPDAHSIGEIDNIHWGVSAARKGGLTREMTWNAMGIKEVEQWLAKKNSRTKTTEVRKLAV
jgi:DNA polymerase (family X)